MVNVVGGAHAATAQTDAGVRTGGPEAPANAASVAVNAPASSAGNAEVNAAGNGTAARAGDPGESSRPLDLRTWRWRPAARRPVAAAGSVLLAAVTTHVARGAYPAEPVAYGLLAAAVVLAAAGALVGREAPGAQGARGAQGVRGGFAGRGNRGLAAVLLLIGALFAVAGAWTAADAYALPGPARLAVTAGAGALGLLLLGLRTPFGRAGLIGAGATAGLTALWELAALVVDGEPARLGALSAVASVVLLGLLPRIALRATGLTAIDDRRSAGSSVSRHHVADALADTHRGLVVATVLTAGSAAAAGWLLTAAAPTPWTVLATAVTAVVLLARARAFPLAVEVVAVFAAAAVLVVRLAALWLRSTDGPGPLLLLGLAAALPLLALVLQPAPPLARRLRRAADLVESTGVVGLLPLTVGVFGVYAHLLGGS